MALLPQVPSNLIPLKVTQLPLAPTASEDSLMMIVYQGNNYQIRVGDLLSVAGVPTTRQVIAGTGMTGGGQLSSNVTLSIAQKGVDGSLMSDTGVTSGVYGDATNIPVLTVDSTGRVTAASTVAVQVSGYVPTTREVIAGEGLSGGGALNNNVTLTANLSNATPESGFQSGEAGVSTDMSRSDHKHPAVDLSSDDQVDNILGLSNGGTARSLVPDAGAIIWCGADGLYVGPVGESGQVLVSSGTGEYTWGSAVIVTPQAANTFFAGPTSGGDDDPLFRTMVNADLPDSGATAGTYGSILAIPVVTVNAKGVVTSITQTSFTGGLSYKGAWNALTNTPTLVSSTGTNGDYYVVSVAGTTNLDGITDWQVGDWALFNGTVWQKIDQTNSVSSVNGQQGAVVLDYADVGAPSTTGTGASGTWAIDVSGNAATATSATSATTADKVGHTLTIGSGLGGTSYDGSAAVTIANTGVLSFSGDSTGLTPATATTGAVTLGGTLNIANGGTGATTAAGAPFALKGANSDITSLSGITGGISTADYIDFDTAATVTRATGRLWWDNADGIQTLNLGMAGSNATMQVGEEIYYRVKASAAITEGQCVMFTGTVGASGALTAAPASGLTADTASYIMGVATEDIALNGWGYVTQFGLVRGINTTGGAEAWVDGQILYYNPAVVGGLTKTVPSAPNAKVQVCAVTYAHASNGSLFVRPAFGGVLGQYEGDVEITTPANGQLLIRNQTDGKWVNATLTDGSGISITEGAGTITITNTAPSSGGTVTSVSGTGTVSGLTLSGTVTTSGSLTLGGTLDLSSPPAIGGTTPAAGTFTTLTATTVQNSTLNNTNTVTLKDTLFTLQDDIDATKQAKFQLSGIATGTTVTYTLPAGSAGASTLVDLATAQSISGVKIFTSSQQNIGSSTGTSTNSFAYGATISSLTKTVNIGTAGLSGSTTNINIGSSVVGSTTNVNAYGTWTFNTPLANTNLANSSITINGSAVSLGGSISVGTVTSVTGTSPVLSSGGTTPDISLASGYGDTQNPYASKTANYFLAAPNGSSGTPTFRAIVAADVPTLNQNTTGTAAGLSATLAIASGGTGQTTASAAFNALSPVTTAGDLIVGDGANSSTRLPVGSNGYVLTSNGTTATWAAPTGGVTSFSAGTTGLTPSTGTSGAVTLAGTLNVANGGTGLTSLTANYIPYGNGTGAYASSSSLTYNSTTGSLAAPVHNSTNGLVVNSMTVSASYTIATGDNAMSIGPMTVASGVAVTVSSGSRWVVI